MGSIITRTNCPCCGSNAIVKVLACKDYTVSNQIFDIWECNDCTIRFTQDIPDQDSIDRYYKSENYISHSDTEKGLVNKLYKIARNYTLNWKMNLVKRTMGKRMQAGSLLDIGCGTGAFFHKAVVSGWSVTGLEPDEGARKICKDKYDLQAEPPGKLFELNSEHYDAVTLWHVLEHVHQLHEYMTQVKRVLKHEGVALIALPNYTSSDAGHYANYWAAYDVPRHLYHFAPPAMSKLAEQHGMRVESVIPMWLDAFYISLLSEGYQNGKGKLGAAVLNGLRSNVKALKNKMECSSLVYIIRHKN
ncbi:MAG: class I SAM-dependent methyltransferase [Ferruginibacter sp.]|nr:class I SAM-dependent methyltransferase [Ferruginibacter sp.]